LYQHQTNNNIFMKYFLFIFFFVFIFHATTDRSYSSELPVGITDSCLFINDDNVNIRIAPDSNAQIVIIQPYGFAKKNMQLNTGYFCRILEIGKSETIGNITSNWIKIRYQCATGWVFGAYTIKAVEDSVWLKNNLQGEYSCIFNDPEICGGEGASSTLHITDAYGIINVTDTEKIEGWTGTLSVEELSGIKLKGSCLITESEIFYFIKAEKPLQDHTQPIGFVNDWDFFIKTE
jgi:hypothetical protein